MMQKPLCQIAYRVPFSETDAMGLVHHANHPKYLERGRVEFLRLVGLSYQEVVKMGFHLPVTDMSLHYRRPLFFDDILLIESTVHSHTRTRIHFHYSIYKIAEEHLPKISLHPYNNGEKPLVTGETHHCCVNDAGRPVDMAGPLLDALKKMLGETSL